MSRGGRLRTPAPGLQAAAPWNDGIFARTAPSLRGPWRPADTTRIRPGAEKGKVWPPASADPGGGTRHAYDPPGPGRTQDRYDAVAAVADRLEGPYSKRWTLGAGAGHNTIFRDHAGRLWTAFFRNPNAGHWADPSRVGDAAAPGVVRLEWTGPHGNRLSVQRRHGRRAGGHPLLYSL